MRPKGRNGMSQSRVRYCLDKANRLVIEDYNWAKSFSNFFPGIAGKWGIPMWVYYVGRAQAVCSAGVGDKDHQILEFYSFNKACQTVPRQGFRTFLKTAKGRLYEPFQKTRAPGIRQTMTISSGELEIRETNSRLGLEFHVLYFPLVNYPLPGLIRELRVRNLLNRPVEAELIDGLPKILPFGMNQEHVKLTARHIEGMMGVGEAAGVPLFRLNQTAADTEQIGRVRGGNFYFSLCGSRLSPGGYIVDPYVVFGESENYDTPWLFAETPMKELLSLEQIRGTKTPSAFTPRKLRIASGATFTLHSLIGYAPGERRLRRLLDDVKRKGFLETKRKENWDILDRIKSNIFTVSSSREFDQYCQQDFLDNVIRGGMPLLFETPKGTSAFYLYSRQNGDLERDYHYFVLDPTYLSQGNGHYRSVHQNRRTDTWFFPETGDANLLTFMNLIQTDGYNPLVVNGLTFTAEDLPGVKKWLRRLAGESRLYEDLLKTVQGSFTPGEFIMKLEEGRKAPKSKYLKILSELMSFCRQNEVGELHEGFWVDHWTYNLDLIDTFLMIYPDRLKELLVGRDNYTFFDDPDVILPRDEKYVEVNGRVRQYGAVVRDAEKVRRIQDRPVDPYKMRTRYGRGPIYTTNLFTKLLCIVANRISTLDPEGLGVEMEADKPGWNDSMNGLPGLLGSSLCETLELTRLCRFLKRSLGEIGSAGRDSIPVFEELCDFIRELEVALESRLKSKARRRAFLFWDESHSIMESYRERTKFGVSGRERRMPFEEINTFLDRCLTLLDSIFSGGTREKLFDPNGVPYTYFINEVSRWRPLWENKAGRERKVSHGGFPLVKPLEFRQRPAALFLEGPVHYLKVHPEESRAVYRSVRNSRIFDRKLKMYKSCESLEGESFEIGRVKAYARGWIENESVYLHMEYKYLLEILRSGRVNEFYRDIRTALIPFLDPKVYGRSILEGASFIVSSAFPDKKLHGQAFQPRLSGITCEWLHIWTLMVAGPAPFYLDRKGELSLRLRPALAGWLFTEQALTFKYWDEKKGWTSVRTPPNCFSFKYIGKTLVVYHNRGRKDTFGREGARVTSYLFHYRDGSKKRVQGESLGPTCARDVREGRVNRIDATLT